MNLLRIDSSARKDSVSRELTEEFVNRWRRQHPTVKVIERDLAAVPFSLITDDWVSAMRVPEANWTERQRDAISLSELFIAELAAADLIVIGTPMHNYTISWPLKAWIDQIVRVGKTVVYGANGPKGTLVGKHVVVISSRGGSYRAGSPRASMDFLEPYLRAILGFVGLTDVSFIEAENQYRPDQAPAGKSAALVAVDETIAALAAAGPAHVNQ